MSQASTKCEYNDCKNIGMTTTLCAECGERFCDEHIEAHINEHVD
jgi:hypothetical protein